MVFFQKMVVYRLLLVGSVSLCVAPPSPFPGPEIFLGNDADDLLTRNHRAMIARAARQFPTPRAGPSPLLSLAMHAYAHPLPSLVRSYERTMHDIVGQRPLHDGTAHGETGAIPAPGSTGPHDDDPLSSDRVVSELRGFRQWEREGVAVARFSAGEREGRAAAQRPSTDLGGLDDDDPRNPFSDRVVSLQRERLAETTTNINFLRKWLFLLEIRLSVFRGRVGRWGREGVTHFYIDYTKS